MPLSRFEKRNQLHLEPPVPDSKEAREVTEKHHAQFGKTVVWLEASESTDVVAGQEITTKVVTPPEEKEELEKTDPEPDPEPEIPEEKEELEKTDPEPDPEPEIPEDLKCPHCGATARTEASYKRNHGDNCLSKP